MPQIVVTIGENGDAEVDIQGGHGPGCKDLAKIFAKLGRTLEEKTKPEFYETQQTQKVTLGGR
jgi:hypothetical protein